MREVRKDSGEREGRGEKVGKREGRAKKVRRGEEGRE